jgi:hypothetical protein
VKKERKVFLGVTAGSCALALGLGIFIHFEAQSIDETRLEVEALRQKIVASRKLIEGTSTLERDVIVQREMSKHLRTILPDDNDMNSWMRTIQDFQQDSGVRTRMLKKKAVDPRAEAGAFDKVVYICSLDADSFEYLDFLDRIETHSRFMRVAKMDIVAARRGSVAEEGMALHKISLDIETFVYEPKNEAAPVDIDSYERKRDLMMGEINRRRAALSLSSFTYRGARGRRDPFVDPRVPVDSGSGLSMREQMELVEELYGRMQAAKAQYALVQAAQNVIEEMMARDDLEVMIAGIETDVRRLQAEGSISYMPSQKRLQHEVIDALDALQGSLASVDGSRGPSVKRLREVLGAMDGHLIRDEFELALDAFRLVADQLDFIEHDPLRKPFVVKLRRKALIARIVREFDEFEIEVSGVATMKGAASVATINGKACQVGEMLTRDLLIHEIHTDEIRFIYRGVVLARRF